MKAKKMAAFFIFILINCILEPTTHACAEIFETLTLSNKLPAASWKKIGDLTLGEAYKIQSIANRIHFPIIVVGSAAHFKRRNVGSSLPMKKGKDFKSDIDYILPFVKHPREERHRSYLFAMKVKDDLKKLPDLQGGIFVRVPEKEFNRIWFVPNHGPIFVGAHEEDPLPLLPAPLEVSEGDLKQKVRPPTDILAF